MPIVATTAFTYPSVDPGFPALGLEELLDAHAELLARIKVCYGNDKPTFERDVLTLVRRYAAFVHLLPATPANYFNVPGGLLRLGLETAFFALQGTDAHIFSGRATISTRRHLEPRWRLATFIAGLCAEVHRTLAQVIVTDREGNEWPAYLQGLQPWLSERGVDRYFLKWVPNAPESPGLALFALPHIVPATTLQHLAQGNSVVVPHMLATLSAMPMYREHNILVELVRRSAALVIDRFLQASTDRYGQPQLGSHLERYLVDALRRLVTSNPSWTPNSDRSRVWYGGDGLFIVWPNAAADIRKLLEADQLPGIPKAPETMLEILLGAGVFEAQANGQPLWSITPPQSKAALEAVKLAAPDVVLAGIEPRPDPLTDALLPTPSAAIPTPGAHPPQDTLAPLPAQSAESASATSAPSEAAHAPPAATPPSPSSQDGYQMELPVSPGAEASGPSGGERTPPRPGDQPSHDRACARQTLTLQTPMRLAPRVRAALHEVVEALNATGSHPPPMACATPAGLFVALAEFERRNVEPTMALRALGEARMLARATGPLAASAAPTSTQTFGDQPCLGLTIAAAFVPGLGTVVEPPASGG